MDLEEQIKIKPDKSTAAAHKLGGETHRQRKNSN